jgi:ABC-type antimicrobial peptide transport system permease subunit
VAGARVRDRGLAAGGGRHLCGDRVLGVDAHEGEIGIRAALGARPAHNLAIVVGDIAKPLVAGVAVGILLSIAGAPALATLLFAVNPIAPVTMTVVTIGLFVVGLSAAIVGAWRLMSIDPIIALRAE